MMDPSLPDSPESFLAVENKIKSLEEATQALKRHRNSLLPISRLPTEIFTIIFSLLHPFEVLEPPKPIASFSISHVCHRWREISLNLPRLWVHINFSRQTPDCVAEMLARAKTTPLHLEAVTLNWSRETFEAFKRQIGAHIHHTRYLSITTTSYHLVRTFGPLMSSAPVLEQLSIINQDHSWRTRPVIPRNLFDGIAPKLIYLCLDNCGVGWKKRASPLFKGLRDLKLVSYPAGARTKLKNWLDALSQMTQLERLTLHDGIPIHSATPPPTEPGLTVVLSSLTELDISASLRNCIAVLAHLVLSALTRLCVDVQFMSTIPEIERIPLLISHVTRNAHGPQDTELLQSLFVGSNKPRAGIAAWTLPRQDADAGFLPDGIHLPRVVFTITRKCLYNSDIPVYDELLTALPLDLITSLTAKGRAPLVWEAWRDHASRWRKLQRVRLFSSAVPAFREMFADEPTGDPLLPSLEELVLVNVSLDTPRVIFLDSLLYSLLTHDIVLKTLDLRTCTATSGAVRFLSQLVLNVLGPVKKESADLNGKPRGGVEVLGEEGESDEVNTLIKSKLRPYWDTDDEYDFGDEDDDEEDDFNIEDDDDFGNEDEDDEDETSSTGSEIGSIGSMSISS